MGVRGYTGEELLRILLNHPKVKICCLQARVEKPEPLSKMLPRFSKQADLACADFSPEVMAKGCDAVFLALPHTVSQEVAPKILKRGKKVIDLSADFRLKDTAVYAQVYKAKHSATDLLKQAVYGLPELYRERIKKTNLVANPGCYPTGVLLGAFPILKKGWVQESFFIADSKSGVTGAGRSQEAALQFTEVNESFRAYRVGEHQHVPEMEQVLEETLKKKVQVVFTPHLVPINRGLLSTLYFHLNRAVSTKDLVSLYREVYRKEPFVRVLPEGSFPEVKHLLYTNFCDIGVKVDSKRKTAIVVTAIDNLTKGASGQAVQNFNLMAGFEETAGL